jgi:hypothetical protein
MDTERRKNQPGGNKMKKVLCSIALFFVLTVQLAYSASITGTVSGYIVDGTLITLSDNSTDTTTTAADGTYSFVDLDNGTYTVTPSYTGATFVPTETEVAIKTSDNGTGTDFAITVVTINVDDNSTNKVDTRGDVYEVVYTDSNSVITGAPRVFRLNLDTAINPFGNVQEISFSSSSAEVNVKIFPSAAEAIANTTVPIIDMDVVTSGSPDINTPRHFINKDTIKQRSLYARITNSGAATSSWRLTMSIGRN